MKTDAPGRLLSIGEFAAATQLSLKPLRLYDEQRLLHPSIALSFTTEGKPLLARFSGVRAWLARMGELPPVMEFRSTLPPRAPIEHARRWATDHRPRVG